MSEQKKDLAYYEQHPEEFPTDALAAAELLKELDAAAEFPVQAPKEEKKPDEKPADTTKEESKAGAPTAAPEPEKKPDGVLTKDGKHVIPYAEMERRLNEAHSSREAEAEARKAAEKYAKELETRLTDATKAQAELKKDGAKPSDAKADQPVTDLPPEVMENLKAEFPTIAKPIEALQLGLKAVLAENEKLRADMAARVEVHDRDRKEAIQDETEALIAKVPDLAAWREKPLLWGAALDVEDSILGNKKFLDEHFASTGVDLTKDDVKRYEMVVARVKQELGLPASASPKNENDLAKKADEKVREAAPASIRSLSDIQGGQPPAGTLEDNIENVPASELAARMLSMTEDQRQKFMSRMF